jgi:hypothetical protein
LNERSFDFDLISKAASIYGEQSIDVLMPKALLEDIMYMEKWSG